MSILPTTNVHAAKLNEAAPGTKPDKPSRPKKKGKNLNQIHSRPLPLLIHPLPAFHPSNPISLLRLAYTWISHVLYPPVSHPAEPYVGYFSPETRSVHITHPDHVRALWEMGFFGKGTLSRSEPNWLEREKARLRRERFGAEDATNARREERRLFKLERARVEAEKIERQRLVEEGRVDAGAGGGAEDDTASSLGESVDVDDKSNDRIDPDTANGTENLEISIPNGDIEAKDFNPDTRSRNETALEPQPEDEGPEPSPENQEHLQLTLVESFFLSYALGVLTIHPAQHSPSSRTSTPPLSPKSSPQPLTLQQLLSLCIQHTAFDPYQPTPTLLSDLAPDDPFILTYVVYHHYRSLGWVVRPGIKFGVDHLLYNRGPAFSHAEFGVIIVPAYTDRFWLTPGGRLRRRNSVVERDWDGLGRYGGSEGDGGGGGGKGWAWLHAVNRVQSQVKKSLVVCYVDVPSPFEVERHVSAPGDAGDGEGRVDIGGLLRAYRVREFVLRRWVPNRTRD